LGRVLLDQFSKPPIIIAGCGRSGTTLLLSILSAHPSIVGIPFETRVFCPNAYNEKSRTDFIIDINIIATHFKDQEIPNNSRWCEKTPKNIESIERILEYFHHNVKILNIVRDGRDVILSRHPENPEIFWITPKRWVNDVKAGLRFETCPQVLTIRYEDLVTAMDDTLKKVLVFLEEDYHSNLKQWHQFTKVKYHEALFEQAKPVYSDSIGRWKERIYKKRIEEFMQYPDALEMLTHYQYIN